MFENDAFFLRNQVLTSMARYADTLRKLNLEEQAAAVEAKAEVYAQGLFQVMLTGFFRNGKSTLLNALTHRQLLRTSVVPWIAATTRIINGKNSDVVTVTFRNPSSHDETVPYDQFRKKYLLNWEENTNLREISYITISSELKYPTVSFIKTPDLVTDEDDEVIYFFEDKADAIVFMFNAGMLGRQTEREYIQRRFAGRGLRNVFFVVNYWNLVQTPEQAQELEANLKHLIGCAFTDADGHFDEALYNQRVFKIDAYTSECARTGKLWSGRQGMRYVEIPVALEADEYTGVPELERALMAFLNTPEKVKAAFAASLPFLAGCYAEAVKRTYTAQMRAQITLEVLQEECKALETEIGNLKELKGQNGSLAQMKELLRSLTNKEAQAAAAVEEYSDLKRSLLTEFNVIAMLLSGHRYSEADVLALADRSANEG